MATYQILYWHDIPVQVRAIEGRQRHSLPLPERFQQAVDQAAMDAGLTDSDRYSDLFHWSEQHEQPGSPQEVAELVAAGLIDQYPSIDWRKTALDLLQNG